MSDVERAREFYCDGLGFRASSSSDDDIVFIDAGGVVLALYPRELLAEDATLRSSRGTGFSGITLAWNVSSRAEVDTALQVASRAGAKILKPGQDAFWGGYSGYFGDLDGYLWEVVQNPYWGLTRRGLVRLPK